MCRHKTMHIFSKRNKTLKKIKVEKKKQAQTQLKKLKFNRQKPKAWTLWRIGPPKTGTYTETGQACMRRNTALAEDHHQHLLHHYSYTIHSHIHRAERERERKEAEALMTVKLHLLIEDDWDFISWFWWSPILWLCNSCCSPLIWLAEWHSIEYNSSGFFMFACLQALLHLLHVHYYQHNVSVSFILFHNCFTIEMQNDQQ